MITVAITAWPSTPSRKAYLLRTLDSLSMLSGPISRWIVSCENGSTIALPPKYEVVHHAGAPELGAHMNSLLLPISGLVMYVQDDTPLLEPLDLTAGAALINSGAALMVRYWYQERHLAGATPLGGGFSLLGDVPNRYSDRPFLASRAFWDATGPYAKTRAACHEVNMEQLCRRRGDIKIAAGPRSVFGHIGVESVFVKNKIWRL